MGRDKAALPAWPFRTLLERQLALLATLGPCELIVSARTAQFASPFGGPPGLRLVRDDGAAGPLGGLVAILRAARASRVLVLAVDAGEMHARVLRRVVGSAPEADDAIGAIPRTTAAPQPLAALWPRSMLEPAEQQLAASADLSLRSLVKCGIERGSLRWFDVSPWDEYRFHGWNQPRDVVRLRRIGNVTY